MNTMNRRLIVAAFALLFVVFVNIGAAEPLRVASVGDSITAGWKLKEADKYVTKLAGLLGEGYDVRNFGHSAYCMLEVAEKSYWDSPMFQAAQDFHPDVVTIMLGTNDAHPNYWPQYEEQYVQDYFDMIAVFQGLPSQPTVIVLGLPYLKPGGRYDGVVALNGRLPGIAEEAGVEFVEIWDVLVDSGLSANQLMKDPIHPSAAAHTIIAETVAPVIAGLHSTCGDGACDLGETPCDCPGDCGQPPLTEMSCSNLIDDDCDELTDCADYFDCSADPGCVCDNDGICEAGEDCENCALDCAGYTRGKPSGRYCCGNGIPEGPEGDGSICDGRF